LEGRIQSPKQEIKEELKELTTPKRKRVVKPKGKAVKEEDSAIAETGDVKPEIGADAVNGVAHQAEPEVKAKAPPKKRAKKSKDTAEA
jgi:hypothetical protein